jgi:hypothetical protein
MRRVSCLALVLTLGLGVSAWAHGGFYVEGTFGLPIPYHPPYYVPLYPAPAPLFWYEPPPLPAGWEPGRWETRYDRRGRPYQVWIPAHLR